MQITMSYGQSGLDLNLPDDFQIEIINKMAMPVLDDPEQGAA
jgi:hypothetical protein